MCSSDLVPRNTVKAFVSSVCSSVWICMIPVAGHIGDVHLVLNFDYEVPSEPGSDGAGFDVDVDDWDDVNMDIVL